MAQPPEVTAFPLPGQVDQQAKDEHEVAYRAELTMVCGNTVLFSQGSWRALWAF